MSINAISSVSLYEYYYTINNNKEKDKKSPLADEMQKYGLKPTDDEALNAVLLQRAKQAKEAQKSVKEEKESKADRPWADIMYQLNLTFNEDPLDDIEDIKEELAKLLSDIKDEELEQDITDLEDYVEKLYITFTKNNVSSKSLLTVQMNNISNLNRVRMI